MSTEWVNTWGVLAWIVSCLLFSFALFVAKGVAVAVPNRTAIEKPRAVRQARKRTTKFCAKVGKVSINKKILKDKPF